MLEYEIAAIYYFVAGIITAQAYFEEVPLDMVIPCVFYPTPTPAASGFSVNAYIAGNHGEAEKSAAGR